MTRTFVQQAAGRRGGWGNRGTGMALVILGLVGVLAISTSAMAASPSTPCGHGLGLGGNGVSACDYGPMVGNVGATDSFTVPSWVSSITITAVGGMGGGSGGGVQAVGGYGALITATVPVTPGETLAVNVGGNGNSGADGKPGSGGIDGGGAGGCGAAQFCGGGGGGASAVLAADSTPLVVAGGGGGGASGSAGGAAGQAGAGSSCLGGAPGAPDGTGNGGGAPYSQCPASNEYGDNGAGDDGAPGQGGAGGAPTSSVGADAAGGGGGGGYGGGGGGQASEGGTPGGGGGGSSYVQASATSSEITADATGRPEVTISWAEYSTTITSTPTESSIPVDVGEQLSVTTTVSGVSPTGWVTFSLYDNPTASGTPLFSEVNVALSNGTAYSNGYTPTSVGTYYWVVSYSGDFLNAPVTSSASGSPVTVTPGRPLLLWASSPANDSIGDLAAAYSFVAYLQGNSDLSGTLTFKVFGPQPTPPTTCAGGTVIGTATVSGSNQYTPSVGSYLLSQQGDYWWYVSYSGDGNNDAAASACGSGMAEDAVGPDTTSLSITAPPSSDALGIIIPATAISADLTGGYSPTGTVSFEVFGPQDTPPDWWDCSGGTTVGTVTVSGNGTYSSSDSFTPAQPGDYWWYASYDGDVNNSTAGSYCGTGMVETVVPSASTGGSSGAVSGGNTSGSTGGTPTADNTTATTTADTTTNPTTPAVPVTPQLTSLRVSSLGYTAGRYSNGRCVKPTPSLRHDKSCHLTAGFKISYALNIATNVAFRFTRIVAGREKDGRCVTSSNAHGAACVQLVKLPGGITQPGNAGSNTFRFAGMMVGSRELRAGNYELTANPGSSGVPKTVRFRTEN